jgi:lysophospholipase L1-like esterase
MKINNLAKAFCLLFPCCFLKAQTPFSDEIRKFEQADSLATPLLQNQIMLYGSSTVRLWDSCTLDLAFPDLKVVNRGFGGSNCYQANLYFERVVLPHKPQFLFFYEGDNDLAGGMTVDSVYDEFKIFIDKVRTQLPDTRLVILSVKHSPSRMAFFKQQKELNQRLRNYTRFMSRVYFLDTYSPLLGIDRKPKREFFMPDMLHMNRKGYVAWAGVVQKFYKKFK